MRFDELPPLLTEQEELELVALGTPAARQRLIEGTLRIGWRAAWRGSKLYKLEREEAEQVAYVAIVKALQTFTGGPGSSFARYAHRAARNAVINLYKASTTLRQDARIEEHPGELTDYTSRIPRPDQIFEAKARAQTVRRLVSRLSLRDRELVALRYAEEPVEIKEIGAAHGVTKQAIHRLEHAALEKLRRFATITQRKEKGDLMQAKFLAQLAIAAHRPGNRFDKYKMLSNPRVLSGLANRLGELVPDDTEMLAAQDLGGAALTALVASANNYPLVHVRSTPFSSGGVPLDHRIEGADVRGKTVALIDARIGHHVCTISAVRELRRAGAVVSRVLCGIEGPALDRDAFLSENIVLVSLIPWARLTPALEWLNAFFADNEGRVLNEDLLIDFITEHQEREP